MRFVRTADDLGVVGKPSFDVPELYGGQPGLVGERCGRSHYVLRGLFLRGRGGQTEGRFQGGEKRRSLQVYTSTSRYNIYDIYLDILASFVPTMGCDMNRVFVFANLTIVDCVFFITLAYVRKAFTTTEPVLLFFIE